MRLKLVYIKRQSLYKFKYNKLCRSVKLQRKKRTRVKMKNLIDKNRRFDEQN